MHGLCPPAPASPIDVDAQHECIEPVIESAVAAEAHVLKTLLALAREIRQPRRYIGYSAFLLMGLLKKARPCVWEGDTLIDLVATFAPWAAEHCTKRCSVEAVCCCLEAQPGGYAALCALSEKHPFWECRHFVACTTVEEAAVADSANTCTTEFERF